MRPPTGGGVETTPSRAFMPDSPEPVPTPALASFSLLAGPRAGELLPVLQPEQPVDLAVVTAEQCEVRPGGALAGSVRLLSRIPGAQVDVLDAGCCGMAGSFGYDRSHYDVSKAIGERKLFPAVRARTPGAAVVAAGTSCRHQVEEFTGARPVHPATLLRSLLPREP